MPSFTSIISGSILTLALIANGHMTMRTPPPYGSPDNSPLDPSGSNFPCKSTSNAGGPVTEMQVGVDQKLNFKGSAVHGGGSCQIALTKDSPATPASQWQVIHSIEGGCPSKSAKGNLGGADGQGSAGGSPDSQTSADEYTYQIPPGFDGPMTLAWTWFNKIGNREMYMNCANVKITGGSGGKMARREDSYANASMLFPRDGSFPPLFKANIPISDCTTAETSSVKFPNPGSSTESFDSDLKPPTGPKCGAAGGSAAAPAASQGSTSPSPSGAAAAQASNAAPAPASGSVDIAAKPGGPSAANSSMASVASAPQAAGSSSATAPSPIAKANTGASAASSPSAPSAQAQAASPAAPATQAQPATAQGGSASAGSMVCSPDGRQFGLQNAAGKAVMQQVAPGTVCKDGAIAAATVAKRGIKRSMRYRQVN